MLRKDALVSIWKPNQTLLWAPHTSWAPFTDELLESGLWWPAPVGVLRLTVVPQMVTSVLRYWSQPSGSWLWPHLRLEAALLQYPMLHFCIIFYMSHKVKGFGSTNVHSLTPCLHLPPHPFLNPVQFGFSLLHARLQHIYPMDRFGPHSVWLMPTLLLLIPPDLGHLSWFSFPISAIQLPSSSGFEVC